MNPIDSAAPVFAKGQQVVFTNPQNRSARSWVGVVVSQTDNRVTVTARHPSAAQVFFSDELTLRRVEDKDLPIALKHLDVGQSFATLDADGADWTVERMRDGYKVTTTEDESFATTNREEVLTLLGE